MMGTSTYFLSRIRFRYRLFFQGLFLVLLVVGMMSCQSAGGDAAGKKQPNILFIVTDDQAPWAIQLKNHPKLTTSRMGPIPSSARPTGWIADSSQLKTPHMSQIAEKGAYLVNAFTPTPVCSPSRASLLTSRYGTEVGITDWIHPTQEPKLGLSPSYVTWAEVLQDVGYTTGLVGKWHLGTQDRYHPTEQGYDSFMGFRSGGTSPADPTLEKHGKRQEFEGFTPNILTSHALQFIQDHQEGPFMLSVHYRAPHAPWLPLPDQDWAPYKDLNPRIPNPNYPDLDVPRVKQMMRRYLANVASVDRNVGRLLGLLKKLGISENTVVIFTSDHGYNIGHNGVAYKGNALWVIDDPPPATENVPKGRRPNMYDRSLRVPFAIRWPGVIEPGTVVEETVTFLDIFPTIVDIAGAKVPDSVTIRGQNALPLLKGKQVSDWNNGVYAEYSMHHGARTDMRAYRTDTWKLVEDFQNPQRDELYNLRRDPAETTNLYDSTGTMIKRVKRRLNQEILDRMKAIGDPVFDQIDRAEQPSL
jgi:uncharacterized sulfatase